MIECEHEFKPNLFCCLKSNAKEIPFAFGVSRVVFKNIGKEAHFQTTVSKAITRTNFFSLIVYSCDFDLALHIVDLIKSSMTILSSEKTYDLESIKNALLSSWNKKVDNPNTYRLRIPGAYFSYTPDLYFATQMASIAFDNAKKENALFKYDMARDLTEVNPLDLSPTNDWVERVYYHSEHLKFGYSIITCHSILEELGLEIKASKQQPSTVEDGAKWNKIVHADLSDRLKKSGINPESTFPWLVRGKYNRPFKLAVNCSRGCDWSDGDVVRDFLITICDAILELDFIRDRIASHGVQERIYELTIYDVENAYALLREILLKYFFQNNKSFISWYSTFGNVK